MAVINKGGALTITSPNLNKVIAAFDKWPNEAPKVTSRALRTEGIQTVKKLKRVTSRNLTRRTGQLARSWTLPQMARGFGWLTMTFVNEAIYSRIHEEGGTITPKTKQYLAIPLSAAKTAAGVARVEPGDLPKRQTFIRYDIIFFKQSKNDPKPVAMFKLEQSVTIPPRLMAWGVILSSARKYERAVYKAIAKLWDKE